MIKVVSWFRRKPGMSFDDFDAYWRHEHPKVVLQLPGLRKYVQNHLLASPVDGGREPFADGVAETWWDDRSALAALRGTGLLEELAADEAVFQDGRLDQLVTEEVVIVNGAIPVDGVKVITWAHRRSDLSLEAAQRYWREEHPKVVNELPGVRRYVQSHHRPARTEHAVMGLPMVWFDDVDQLRANARSSELAAVRADEPNFLQADNLPFVVVKEHHII